MIYNIDDIKHINPQIKLNNYSRSFKQMQMETCIMCKSHCKQCMGFGAKEHESIKMMNKETMIRCIDIAKQVLNINSILLQISGEFFCNPEAIHLLDYIESKYNGLDLMIDTSGLPITDEIIERLKTIRNNNIKLSISLWAGNKKLYKENHGVDGFDHVDTILKKLIELHKTNSSFNLQLSTAYVDKKSVESVRKYLKNLCKKYFLEYKESDENFLGNKGVLVNYIRNFNTFIPLNKKNKIPEDYAIMGDKVKSAICYINEYSKGKITPYRKSEPTRCDYLAGCMVIRADGYVVPCFQKLSKPESAYFNVNDEDVQENPMIILEKLSNKNPYVKKINEDNYINGAFEECKNCFTRLTCR